MKKGRVKEAMVIDVCLKKLRALYNAVGFNYKVLSMLFINILVIVLLMLDMRMLLKENLVHIFEILAHIFCRIHKI